MSITGLAELPWDECRCGHQRADHYTYILNGHEQVRCKQCDPFTRSRAQQVAIQPGTYLHAMYHAADHDFEPAEPDLGVS